MLLWTNFWRLLLFLCFKYTSHQHPLAKIPSDLYFTQAFMFVNTSSTFLHCDAELLVDYCLWVVRELHLNYIAPFSGNHEQKRQKNEYTWAWIQHKYHGNFINIMKIMKMDYFQLQKRKNHPAKIREKLPTKLWNRERCNPKKHKNWINFIYMSYFVLLQIEWTFAFGYLFGASFKEFQAKKLFVSL